MTWLSTINTALDCILPYLMFFAAGVSFSSLVQSYGLGEKLFVPVGKFVVIMGLAILVARSGLI